MSLTLMVQLCGWPLLGTMSLVELFLVVMAAYLVFSAKRENLLQAFLPLTAMPVVVGLFNTFVGFMTSIDMQVDETSTYAIDPGFLLQMNLVPLIVGCIFALPSATLCVIGRMLLAWRNSGIKLFPPKPPADEPKNTEAKKFARETDDYLEKLVRAR